MEQINVMPEMDLQSTDNLASKVENLIVKAQAKHPELSHQEVIQKTATMYQSAKEQVGPDGDAYKILNTLLNPDREAPKDADVDTKMYVDKYNSSTKTLRDVLMTPKAGSTISDNTMQSAIAKAKAMEPEVGRAKGYVGKGTPIFPDKAKQSPAYFDKLEGAKDVTPATTYLMTDEGYSQALPANVPSSKSGVTIAGLDLYNGGKDTLDIIKDYLPADVYKEVSSMQKLQGTAAKDKFNKVKNKIVLSNSQIAEMQQRYIDKNVVPVMKQRVGEEVYNTMPESIKQPWLALSFLNKGNTSATALKEYLLKPSKATFEKAYKEFDTYWGSSANTKHNQTRAHRVRDALKEHYDSIK